MFSKSQLTAISKHLRDLATIIDSSNKTEEQVKRGRKPGAVPDDVRCQGFIGKGDRCKNRSITNGLCGKHTKPA